MPVQVVITMNENGSVSINGPFDNKVLMLGLLETGKAAYLDFINQKARETRIVPATMIPPSDLIKGDS